MSRIYEDIKKAKGYGRLSLEDREKKNFSLESDSIISQKVFIQQYVDEKNIKYDGYYYDDGITGLTFERDGWNQLLKDIDKGLVDCIITKDLSRLGRDHTETGYYIEKFFPEHKIRYISLNDNWDSKYDSVDLLLWKLAYNDVYCADISRKVKSILNSKKKQGLYVGSFAPYGYIKDPNDKHKLVVDNNTGPIVRKIFALAYSGVGNCQIAKTMTDEKYPTPGTYSGRGKQSYNKKLVGNIWTTGMIRRILENEVYLGDLTQCKIKKASYKSKKTIRNDREDWIIVKDTHEPLVSRDVFSDIQKRLVQTSKKYNRLPGENHLLSKLLYCKDCNHRISISWKNSKNHSTGRSGVCNFYKKYSKNNVCTPHYINYDELETQVISYIKMICKKYLLYLNTPELIKDNYKNIQNNIYEYQSSLKKINNELDKAENFMLKLYEDKITNVINDSVYKTLSEKKNSQIDNLKFQIQNIESEINKLNNQLNQDHHKISDIKTILNKFLNSKVITQDLIHQIIDKIYVSENEKIQVIFLIEELEDIK